MKTHTITEQQVEEIAGRLNSLVVQGVANSAHILAIASILEAVAKPKEITDNVVDMKDASNG